MQFYIMTLFPEMVMGGLKTSIIGRAIKNELLSIEAINIRDYAFNKHNSVDDYPYGGGAGMLMQAEPVYQCYKALEDRIGKLENGMEADIIAVEGNPLEDVSRLSQVGLVMKGGVVYRQP